MTIVTPQMGLYENPYCTKSVNEKLERVFPKKLWFCFNNRIALESMKAESSKCGRIPSKDLRILVVCVLVKTTMHLCVKQFGFHIGYM